ncbi:Strigolactone esterase D14 [Linum grandiflorum]
MEYPAQVHPIARALNANLYGNGTQTLVLSYGYGLDQNVWHLLLPYLVCCFKVLVFDLAHSPNVATPGFYDPRKYSTFEGYSQDLVSLLDELELKNTVYLGHSMSALIGCIAATQRPDLFQHLILLSGSPRYINDEGYTGGSQMSQLNALFQTMEADFSNWVRNFAPMAVTVNDTSAIEEFKQSLGKMNPEIAVSVAKAVFLGDLRAVLPKVTVPTSIIQSREDLFVPKFVGHYMKKNLGRPAKLKFLNTEGHFPQLTAHHLVLKALKKFGFITDIKKC